MPTRVPSLILLIAASASTSLQTQPSCTVNGNSPDSTLSCGRPTGAKGAIGAARPQGPQGVPEAGSACSCRDDGKGNLISGSAAPRSPVLGVYDISGLIVADGVKDNYATIQAAVNAAYSQRIREVSIGAGDIVIKHSISVPYGIVLGGRLSTTRWTTRPVTRLIPTTDGTYTNHYMIGLNTTDFATPAHAGYMNGGGLTDVVFYNPGKAVSNIYGVIAFGDGTTFTRVASMSMDKTIVRGPNAVSDNFVVRGFSSSNNKLTGQYPIELYGSGDSADISDCAFDVGDQGILIAGKNETGTGSSMSTARIANCINGNMMIGGIATTIDNWHAEGATVTVEDGAQLTIHSAYIGQTSGISGPPINTQYGQYGSALTMDSVAFRWAPIWDPVFNGTMTAEVSLADSTAFSCVSCSRAMDGLGVVPQHTGIRLQNASGTPVADWDSNSQYLLRRGTVFPRQRVAFPGSVGYWPNSFAGIDSIALISTGVSGSWTLPTGTYYYTSVLLLDQPSLTGKAQSSAEASIAISDTKHAIQPAVHNTYSGAAFNGMVRFYRGTSSGSYDTYVDVPFVYGSTQYPVDDGTYMEGMPWIARSAGPIDTLVSATAGYYSILGSGIVFNPSTSTGTFNKVVSSVVPGSYAGFIADSGDGTTAQSALYRYRNNGVNSWDTGKDAVGDFELNRYDSKGTFLDSSFMVDRSTGQARFNDGLKVFNGFQAGSSGQMAVDASGNTTVPALKDIGAKSSSGTNCLQIGTDGTITNTGAVCGAEFPYSFATVHTTVTNTTSATTFAIPTVNGSSYSVGGTLYVATAAPAGTATLTLRCGRFSITTSSVSLASIGGATTAALRATWFAGDPMCTWSTTFSGVKGIPVVNLDVWADREK